MKTFITGATGFIGTHLANRLAQTEHKMSCLVRATSQVDLLKELGAELIEGDVTNKTSIIKGMSGCDWVVHLANIYSFWEPDQRLYRKVNVEGTELGLAYIGIEGLHHIYPDDEALTASVFRLVPEPFVPQAGIAGNKFLAYLTARSCSPGSWRVLTEPAEDFLHDITCDVLPVSTKSKKKLHRFGLHTLGRIASLSSGPLLSQFGSEGKKIYDLARGFDDTPLYPRKMGEVIEESITLSSVTISIESILAAQEVLLGRVFGRINRAGLGIRRLAVWMRTWNEEQWEKSIWFKEPAMNIRTAVNRIRRLMEANPQPGPVEQTGLIITHLGYPGGRQVSLFREKRSQDHIIEDIRQLELRLGSPQVYQVKEVEPWSRIPERRYVLVPPTNP